MPIDPWIPSRFLWPQVLASTLALNKAPESIPGNVVFSCHPGGIGLPFVCPAEKNCVICQTGARLMLGLPTLVEVEATFHSIKWKKECTDMENAKTEITYIYISRICIYIHPNKEHSRAPVLDWTTMERPGGRISQSIRLIVCVTMWYKIPLVGLIFFFASFHVCKKSEKQAEPVGYESDQWNEKLNSGYYVCIREYASDKNRYETTIHFNLK